MRNEINSIFRKVLEKIGPSSTLIFRLNHKNSGNIIDGTVEAERKQVLQNWKTFWWNLGNSSNWKLKARLELNLNALVIMVLIKWRGISFHSWKLSSYNCFIQEHWRLAILIFILTFLRPPVAKESCKVLCLFFGVHRRFPWKFFCIFSISSIIWFGTTNVKHKWSILDKANVLKTIILPSKVKFLMRHILRTF